MARRSAFERTGWGTRRVGSVDRLISENRVLREKVRALSAYRDLAYRDHLTGLYNRRLFDERMAEELERAQRADGRLALAIIDLDNFKLVNDLAGHAAGDLLLREVGGLLRAAQRRCDVACRLGGDEFALIFPATGRRGAERVLGRVRADLAEKALGGPRGVGEGDAFAAAGALPPLSLSAGISSYPSDGKSVEDLWRIADGRMYAEKRTHHRA
ncbi:MAG: GGDEF domain-containing protein [Deltaproteobacteria bacterium]|nr:GGDEF domain-containing protein [Deltaproteobacteria bacterium]